MFNIGDKVVIMVDNIERIGEVTSISESALKVKSYSIFVKSLDIDVIAAASDMIPYQYKHITNSFSKIKNNEEFN